MDSLGMAIFWVIVGGIYMLPTTVAICRKHPQTKAIFALNLFLGETGIGWVGALVWALFNVEPPKGNRK